MYFSLGRDRISFGTRQVYENDSQFALGCMCMYENLLSSIIGKCNLCLPFLSLLKWTSLYTNSNCCAFSPQDIIDALAFSPCGRFLASAGGDKRVLVWDMAHGHLIAEMASHTSTIYAIAFSRDCNILASGELDIL